MKEREKKKKERENGGAMIQREAEKTNETSEKESNCERVSCSQGT